MTQLSQQEDKTVSLDNDAIESKQSVWKWDRVLKRPVQIVLKGVKRPKRSFFSIKEQRDYQANNEHNRQVQSSMFHRF